MPRYVPDQVGVCSMALRHLGQSSGIVDIEDRSEAAEACRVFYDSVLDEVIRDFPWPFAATFASVALVAGPTESDPAWATPEWAYSYRVPADCIHVRRILNGISETETQRSRVPYRTTYDSGGLLILTNFAPIAATDTTPAMPMIEYTCQADTNSLYPADFGQMLALLLAVYIAPTVTGGDKFKLGERAMAKYEWARQRAQNNAANEQQPDMPVNAEWIQARGDSGFFPYGGGSNWTAYPGSPPDL